MKRRGTHGVFFSHMHPCNNFLHNFPYTTASQLISVWVESELLYDQRFTANQFVLATSPLRLTTSNFIIQLNTCGYSSDITSSLTRGWVCRLQLLMVLASVVILGSESRGTYNHILLSQIRDSPNLEGQVPIFLSPRNRVARLYPQALGSLVVASYDSQNYGGSIRPRLNTGSVWVAPTVFKIIPRQGPLRKHSPSVFVEACLPRRCIATLAAQTT
jgi:hypothetical protein